MYSSTILPKVRALRIPHSVSLELTYRCNLDCFYCYNDREKPGKPLSLAQYERLLRDLARMQTLFLMFTGGEPLMHPHFFAIGGLSRELGFAVQIRTNGHSLIPSVAKRILREIQPYSVEVSLHGATPEVHDRQTRVPGSFARLLDNLKSAQALGLRLGAVMTPTAWNEHQIEDMFRLCDELGLPLRVQGPVAPRDNGDPTPLRIRPSDTAWDRAVQAVKRRQPDRSSSKGNSPEEPPALCGVGVAGLDIDPYGNVLACMHLRTPAGNLHEQSIEAIWQHSPIFQRARQASINAAQRFSQKPPRQLGAPLFCIAVEENLAKAPCSACAKSTESD